MPANDRQHPAQVQTRCPHCDSLRCERLPASVLGSTERWFECRDCHRLWMQPREEQGATKGDR